ncbi:hypothetical protein PGTUg99_016029 [Puccinia graminis f. sp. tritici]|uniref:Uncharacterized protein n=1 Tax=Puccinia graminis f. sp. tritici TaxID=56615 RepID=A0A5B0PI10_PUCGR|nr:hypothetical protein PGTUg99_016029 [Puccinia graminis f. sp. tritici]
MITNSALSHKFQKASSIHHQSSETAGAQQHCFETTPAPVTWVVILHPEERPVLSPSTIFYPQHHPWKQTTYFLNKFCHVVPISHCGMDLHQHPFCLRS